MAALGETGEIVVVPPADGAHFGIFMGYCGDDAAYDEVWEGGVYHTRDLATMDENGYITYVSRTDDVIKSCGFRVSPFEVESVLMQHPAVLECAVTGVPDLGRGFRIKATIVLTDGYEGNGNLSRDLQQFVLQNTASYKCPEDLRVRGRNAQDHQRQNPPGGHPRKGQQAVIPHPGASPPRGILVPAGPWSPRGGFSACVRRERIRRGSASRADI